MLPSVNVVLVRHAETRNNQIQMVDMHIAPDQREPDALLTDNGLLQSDHLAHYLSRKTSISKVIVSPMRRTLQTVRPLFEKANIPVDVWLDLHEEGGVFNGTRDAHLKALGAGSECLEFGKEHGISVNTEIKKYLGTEPTQVVGPCASDLGWWRGGFESPQEVEKRVDVLIERIWSEVMTLVASSGTRGSTDDQPKSIILITHGLLMDSLTRRFLNIQSDRSKIAFFAHNCAMSVFQFHVHAGEKGPIAVACLNNTSHISPLYQSGHTIGKHFKSPPTYFD